MSAERTVTEWRVAAFDEGDALPDVLLATYDETLCRKFMAGEEVFDGERMVQMADDYDPPYDRVVVQRSTVTRTPWEDVPSGGEQDA